jgi:lambda family phage portal protein
MPALRVPFTRKTVTLPSGGKVDIRWTIPDRIVNYFNPASGQERLYRRSIMAISGAYSGASRSRRSIKGWNPLQGSADSDLLDDLETLRNRSRDLVRNAPLATGAINTTVGNVVGAGLTLQSRIDRDVLPMSDDEADTWEASAEREWRLWAESKECHADRVLNFAGFCDLAFRQVLENGDVLVTFPRFPRGFVPYSLKLQAVEADRVSNTDFAPDTDELAGGVHRDEHGAPVAYDVLDQHPGSTYRTKWTWSTLQAWDKSGRFPNCVLLYKMLRPGQARGVPFLAPVVETIKQLTNYGEAEIMAAVVSGYVTAFIESPEGEEDFAPVQESEGVDGSTEMGRDPYNGELRLGNGAIISLGSGEKLSSFNPSRPNSSFEPFVLAWTRQIGVALDIPFEVLIKHFTSSYSASRAALLDAWRMFKTRRKWLVDNLCAVVYELLISEAIMRGRLRAPGFFTDPIVHKAYLGSEWHGLAMPQIDPQKDIEAAKERVALTITTRSQEKAEFDGGDWDRTIRQTVKERKMLIEAGIDPNVRGTSADGSASRPDERPQGGE